MMEYRRLGKSGLQVSALSLGSWLTFGKQISDQVAEQLMVASYDAGINFFDNAEIYARGRSELVMGKIIKNLGWERSSYVISSKAFFGDGGQKPNQTGLSRKHLVEACHAALKRLQLDYLDLFYCHRPDKNTPIEETVWTMNLLIQQGKILYWGTSEWSAQEIMEAHHVAERYKLIGPVMEQPQYNMFHRERMENEYRQIFKNYGMGTTVFSPLASGLLSGKYNGDDLPADTRMSMKGMEWLKDRTLTEENLTKTRRLAKLANDLDTSLPVFSLGWCLKNPNVSTVILGASKLSHLEENLMALDILPSITDKVMDEVDLILGNKPVPPSF